MFFLSFNNSGQTWSQPRENTLKSGVLMVFAGEDV